jgi:hypothetical protein
MRHDALDLPVHLDDAGRRCWLAATAREWNKPDHGRAGARVLIVRTTRAALSVVVDPPDVWARHPDDDVVKVIRLHAETRASVERVWWFPDDGAMQQQFRVPDPVAWAALKWDLALAALPAADAWPALKLDVAWKPAMATILDRLRKHQPGAYGLLAALCFDVTPSTSAGKTLARRVHPTLSPLVEGIGDDARRRLEGMCCRATELCKRSYLAARDGPSDGPHQRALSDWPSKCARQPASSGSPGSGWHG